jgi:hypothetical protein
MVYPLLRWAGEDMLYTETVSVVEPFLVGPTRDGAEAAWRQGTDRYHGAGAWAALPDSTRAALLPRTPILIERCHAMLSNPTTPDDCRHLSVRTLVLCGARTGEPERRLAEIVAGLISRCFFGLIEGAGHMSPLTHPAAVAAMIRAHLSSGGSGPTGPALLGEGESDGARSWCLGRADHATAVRRLALLALRPLSVRVRRRVWAREAEMTVGDGTAAARYNFAEFLNQGVLAAADAIFIPEVRFHYPLRAHRSPGDVVVRSALEMALTPTNEKRGTISWTC